MDIFTKMEKAFAELPQAELPKQKNTQEEDAYIALVEKSISGKQHEIKLLYKLLDGIKEMHHEENKKIVTRFLHANEKNFYNAKPLVSYKKIFQPSAEIAKEDNYYEIYGKSDAFDLSLKKVSDGHYKFTLPPMVNKKTTEKKVKEGISLNAAVLHLIRSFDIESGDVRMLTRPIAIFVHYFDRTKSEVLIPDGDNLDVKVVLDALQGFFISDDNLSRLSLLQCGQFAETEYTVLHLMEHEKFVPWIVSEGQDLFKE